MPSRCWTTHLYRGAFRGVRQESRSPHGTDTDRAPGHPVARDHRTRTQFPRDRRRNTRRLSRQSDGSSRNVTNEAAWGAPSDSSVLTISSTSGLASAHDCGADVGHGKLGGTVGLDHHRDCRARPARFGWAASCGSRNVPVFGARVEVTSGTGQGLTTTTAGTYRLYGVAGDVDILVTAGRVPGTAKACPGREPPG